MSDITKFLTNNGFVSYDDYHFENEHCYITIFDDYYEILDYKINGTMHSPNLNIYWLIGVLTWNDYIDKNYKGI